MKSMKTNIGLLMAFFTIGIAAITGVALYGNQTELAMANSAAMQFVGRNQGQVAGVAIEQATVTFDRGTGTKMSVYVDVPDGANVLDAVKAGAQAYNLTLDINTSSNMGAYINGIGDKIGGQDNNYWIAYLNGTALSIAVDKQPIKPGDQIEMKFEKSIF